MITAYSIVMSIILFNASLIAVYLLRRKQDFIARYGIRTLLLITVLGCLRLILPVDFDSAFVVRSYNMIPTLQRDLNYQLIGDRVDIGDLLLAVWIIGTIVFVVKDVANIIRFKSIRDNYIICENRAISKVADKLGLTDKVVITPCVQMPHVAGHFRQKIYTPPLDLSEADWDYVLMHEMQHIAAHDQMIKLMFLLLRSIFWWNPASHLFIRELDAILELRCDNAVTTRLGEEGSFAYFSAMLNVIKQMLPSDDKALATTSALVGGTSKSKPNVKHRFEVYRNSNKRRSKIARNLIHIFLVLIFVASYFVIVQPAYYPPEEDLVGTNTVEVNETTFIIFNGNDYCLYVENEKIMEIAPEELANYPYNIFPIYNGG